MAGSPAKISLGQINHLLDSSEVVDDGCLLQRFVRQRDEEAFARLVARHGRLVLGVCRRVLGDRHAAEDVFQATFLVLARRAAAIRKPGSLSSYLHGVAYRLALKVRGETERRRVRERRLPPPREAEEPDLSWREVRGLIDEELFRLPERLRLPLVRCYLEGETQDEAARRLGWPRGTLKRRLERGRDLLRTRLVQRGVTLSAGLLATVLVADASHAAESAALRSAAVRAALTFRGDAATPAALLARTLLPSASTLRLKLLGAFLLVLSCAAAAGLGSRQAAAPPSAKAESEQPVEAKRVRTDRYGDALPEGAKLRLGTVRLRQGQPTYDAVFTPDGKTVIVGDGGGGIVFWDVATAREVRRLHHAQNVISALAITPDGKRLAAGQGQIVDLWDIASGKMVQHKVTNKGIINQLLFTPDGKTLAVADGTPTMIVWDIANNKKLHELKGHQGDVACMTLSPDGKTLASGSWRDGHIRLWDLASGEEKLRFVAHEQDVFFVAFSPDGKTLASRGNTADHIWATRTPGLCFWDAATGAKVREIPNHYPLAFAYSPDGKTMATIEGNRKLQTYDVQTGKLLRQFDAPPRIMTKVVISPDGKTMATLWGAANAFDLWDATRGRLLHSFEGHQGGVYALAFAADGQTLFSADGTDRCLLTAWDTTTGALRGRFGTDEDRGHALAMSPDGKRLAIGSADSLRLWDPATRKEVHRYNPYWFTRGGGHPVLSVSWSADGKRLASQTQTSPDWTIRVWDTAANRQLRAIKTGLNWPSEIALSPDGSIVATGGDPGGAIQRWSVADGKELPPIVAPQGRVHTLAFNPDGSTLASGGERSGIHLCNAATGRLQRSWDTKTGFLRLAFSRDGRMLVTGHEDNTVHLWEAATGAERACFAGHRGPVASVALSRDGRTLASGSADTTILLWDATRGADPGVAWTAEQLRALWTDLGGDAKRAYRAMWQLAVSPRVSLPFLAERLRPAVPLDAARQRQVERLLADLDNEAFAIRQNAETELEKMGEAIEPALRKALEGKPSLEVRRRIEKMLEKMTAVTGERLRELRALEALEHMDTPEARRLVDALAAGEPAAWLTEQARRSRKLFRSPD
jgi:RNA polymerase sigma factor (sigma-70 family)